MAATNIKDKPDNDIIRINTHSRLFNWCMIVLCFVVLLAVRIQVNYGTTGDEPYYLLMDYSLIHDHDLNLKNNFQQKDYLSFYPNSILRPQGVDGLDSAHVKNVYYSTHGMGVPLFLLPGFFIAAKSGAVFEMAMLATFVVYLTWVWTKQITKNRKIAYLAAAILTSVYFFNGIVGAIYPEMLIAAISLITLIVIERYYKQLRLQLLLGLILGFSILVHLKTLDYILPALTVLSYKLWKTERKLPWGTVLIVAAFLAYYELSLYHWFGHWNLSTLEGGQSFGANPFDTISAMLFDSNRGILVYSPVLLLIFTGLPLWLKKHPGSLITTLAILLPSMIVLSIIPNWYGANAPTDRFIIDFLPAFIPAIAFSLDRLRLGWQQVVIFILAAITFLISFDATMLRWPLINGSRPPLFAQIYQHAGIGIDHWLPTYLIQFPLTTLINKYGYIELVIGYMLIAGLVIYGFFLSRPRPKKYSQTI